MIQLTRLILSLGLSVLLTVTNAQEQPCIAIVGASVPHGDAIFMIPGHGFFTAQTQSLVEALEQTGQLDNYVLRDHTSPATTLHWYGDNSYFQTPEYDALLEDACAINIILPFYNDIQRLEHIDGPDDYNAWMGYLAQSLKLANPDTSIIVLNFFSVMPSGFTLAVYSYITPDSVSMYNLGLDDACQPDGILDRIQDTECYDISGLFDGLTTPHVLLDLTESQLNEVITVPLASDVREQLAVYFRENPDGRVFGDGVHLTAAGKERLAQYIADRITQKSG